MPHVGGSGGEDLASTDEIKVFKDEGEEEERSSENLTDLKSSLVTEGEKGKSSSEGYSSGKNSQVSRPGTVSQAGKPFETISHATPIGYVVSPYPHPNGSLSMTNKVNMIPPTHSGSPLPFVMYNSEAFAQPPPAHMGIPPVHIDPKTGIPRPPMYPIAPPGQYPHPVFSPDFTQQLQWHAASAMYPMTSAGFRGPYPPGLPTTTASLTRFSPPTLLPHHPGIAAHTGIPHSALITPKQEIHPQDIRNLPNFQLDQKPPSSRDSNNATSNGGPSTHHNHSRSEKKAPHIKKPLNAFMLYMKEMRAKVVAECTLKESAAINQILGRRWHSLSREEQAKYYDMARKERQLHMQLYPGWSARDNYAQHTKKKKRKKDKLHDGEGSNPKKCRARFGLDQQSSWCKPCRRKKKCIRYVDGSDNALDSEDNIGSAGSVEAPTPDSKSAGDSDNEHLNVSELSLSSPKVPSDLDNRPNNRIHSLPPESSPTHPLHPLSIHHLTQPHCNSTVNRVKCDPDIAVVTIPQLPTPPSTDSSTTAAPPMLTVT